MSEVRVSHEEGAVTHFVDRVVGFRFSGPDFFYSVETFRPNIMESLFMVCVLW